MAHSVRERAAAWLADHRGSVWLIWWLGTLIGVVGAAMTVLGLRGSTPGDLLGLLAADPTHPYGDSTLGAHRAYLWSPAVVQLVLPIRDAAWFVDAWRASQAAALVVLAGPFTLLVLLSDEGFRELRQANLDILLGLAIVAGFRWPATWAVVLLTKVTPGVGLLWFAVRREWRALAIVGAATAGIVLVSAAISPTAWVDWIALLTREAGQPLDPAAEVVLRWPLFIRLVLAAGLVIVGARTDQRWTVLIAAYLALPATWPTALTILVGLLFPPLWGGTMPSFDLRRVRFPRPA